MIKNRIKSYGERYISVENKYKVKKRVVFKLVFSLLIVSEVVLGILWYLGF